jgi:hypothetical protein
MEGATMDLTAAPHFSPVEDSGDDAALLAILKASLSAAGVGEASSVVTMGSPDSPLRADEYQEQKTA